jgi:NDP-sugar pyrophosphorylase family protein
MDFAIIAAGEGSRLKAEGFNLPKAMVNLDGLPMIQRLINIFLRNKAERIFIIINEDSAELESYLDALVLPVPLTIIKKNTPSSFHSFYALAPYLVSDKICVTTVDTVFDEDEFSAYIETYKNSLELDGLMAVTSFVDDESPLHIATDADLMITGFDDESSAASAYVSGGIYCLRQSVLPAIKKAAMNGIERMRNFQRSLITEGLSIKAYPFSKIIDIDHVSDIHVAEEWLADSSAGFLRKG